MTMTDDEKNARDRAVGRRQTALSVVQARFPFLRHSQNPNLQRAQGLLAHGVADIMDSPDVLENWENVHFSFSDFRVTIIPPQSMAIIREANHW
jgi:hypothetical protein